MEENKPALQLDLDIQGLEESVISVEEKIDSMTSHADALDYTIAAASGVLTGFIDIFFVGETELDIDKVQKLLVNRYHTANDDEYKHKNKNGKWISSPMYHRLQDLAHHPTPRGLFASILVRYLRLVCFNDGSDKKPHVFFASKPQSKATQQLELKQFVSAWIGAIFSGLFIWLTSIAENKCAENNGSDLPEPLKKLINALKSTPVVIEILKAADSWMGHIMSDVSTPQGVPGIFLSSLQEIAALPGINKTNLPALVDKLYNDKKLNLPEWSGVAFVAAKKQSIPVLANEIFVRGFYFVRHLVDELHGKKAFNEVDWTKVIPFGNRTVERMITVATASFSAVDIIGAAIQSAITQKPGKMFVYINYIGLTRVSVALVTEAVMEYRKNRGLDERMRIKAELLYTMRAKLLYQEKLLWAACEDADKSVAELSMALTEAMPQIQADLAQISTATEEIATLDAEVLEEKNPGLARDILDLL